MPLSGVQYPKPSSAITKGVKIMTDQERRDARKSMLYDLRLIVKASEKVQYTKDELLDLFDTIAAAKDQE